MSEHHRICDIYYRLGYCCGKGRIFVTATNNEAVYRALVAALDVAGY
jgi:hypothetical protein